MAHLVHWGTVVLASQPKPLQPLVVKQSKAGIGMSDVLWHISQGTTLSFIDYSSGLRTLLQADASSIGQSLTLIVCVFISWLITTTYHNLIWLYLWDTFLPVLFIVFRISDNSLATANATFKLCLGKPVLAVESSILCDYLDIKFNSLMPQFSNLLIKICLPITIWLISRFKMNRNYEAQHQKRPW